MQYKFDASIWKNVVFWLYIHYTENRKEMPSLGEKVETEKGTGTVVSIDILKKIYVVDVPNEGRIEVTLKSKCDECEKCN